jgi:transcriptional adapter 2-alpha
MGYTVLPLSEKRGSCLNRDRVKDATRGGKKEQDLRETIAQLPGADLPGFMPLRQDFEFEHDNSAELILADMEFAESDHPSEKALKLDVVKIYNQKLDERDSRKQFVIESGLVDIKKTQQADRRRSKEERDMVTRCRMFSRFQSPSEQEALVASLLLARRLKKQLDLFVHYRTLGIRTLEEAREYEARRRRKEQEIRLKKSKQGTDYLPAGSAELGNSSGGGSSSSGTLQGRNKSQGGSASNVAGLAPRLLPESPGKPTDSEVASAMSSIQRNAPDGNILTPDEIEICYKLDIMPKQYIALQSVLVREAFRNGTLTRGAVSDLINMDEPSKDLLCDFFVRSLHDKFPDMPLEGTTIDNGNGSSMEVITGAKRGRDEE